MREQNEPDAPESSAGGGVVGTNAEDRPDPVSGAARLFDLRLLIGGLFTLYGVVVTIVGIADSSAEIDKAAGVRINLWMGLGMLVLGLLFLLWVKLSPTARPPSTDPGDHGDGLDP